MVAHPDDCVIFGWSFMYNQAHMHWTVAYLTYESSADRGRELASFWQRRGIPCVFLGHTDDHRDLATGRCSFDQNQARQQIQSLIADYDIVLTHDSQGDYGHLHHRFVHDCVVSVHARTITFAPITGSGMLFHVPSGGLDINELPLHAAIIRDFHQHQHANRYHVPECCMHLLKV